MNILHLESRVAIEYHIAKMRREGWQEHTFYIIAHPNTFKELYSFDIPTDGKSVGTYQQSSKYLEFYYNTASKEGDFIVGFKPLPEPLDVEYEYFPNITPPVLPTNLIGDEMNERI